MIIPHMYSSGYAGSGRVINMYHSYVLLFAPVVCMMALALAELIYTLVIFATGHPVEGWTTTMFVITVGFAGLFAVLTIIVKYLSLLLNLTFRQQKYLVESIEKLQK